MHGTSKGAQHLPRTVSHLPCCPRSRWGHRLSVKPGQHHQGLTHGVAWLRMEQSLPLGLLRITINESMAYDHNGNIQKLVRKQGKRGIGTNPIKLTAATMDSLSYTYKSTNANALLSVEDASTAEGFKNGNTGTDYTYDFSGNVTSDKNKGMDSIRYNMFGKVVRIKFSDGKVVKYTYDASGAKLTMKTYSGDTLKTTTDYANGFVYENGVLSFFGAPEGRVVNANGTLYHEYSIADHQGNTRVVFSSATPAADSPLATFESDSNDKASEYLNSSTNLVTFLSANHTSGGSKVVKMNSTYKFGPAKSVRVYPGDKIDMEVWEYHEGSSGFGTGSPSLATVINNAAGLFGGVSAAGGESGLIYDGFDDGLTFFGVGGNQGDTRPAAYLNFILLDDDYKVVDAGWQLAPATTFTKQKLSFPTKTIKTAGYIYVWLSYEDESTNWVYFDDFKVTHTKTNVVQYNEYYPFGLQTDNSWTRSGNKNDYKYNAANELNSNTGWYEMFYRGYDPTIGRMLQVDPYATMYSSVSTYNFAMNNPVLLNDPTGGYIYANAAADRLAKINNPDLYTQQWAEDFDSYLASLPPSGGGGGFSTSNPAAIAIILQAARSGISGGDLVSFVSGSTSFHMEIGGINYGFRFNMNQDGYSLFCNQVTEGKEGGWASENDLIFVAGDNFSSPESFSAKHGESNGNGGFDWFVGGEGAATMGWKNFALEAKNVGGMDYKRDARDWRVSASTKYGGSRPTSPNRATIDRTSVSFGYGATIQRNKDIVNGVEVFTESYSVGYEAFGVQANFDSKGNITDVRFGFDSGVSVAAFVGVEFSVQMGGIYVFE
jgi:RHS repeat-associated protein